MLVKCFIVHPWLQKKLVSNIITNKVSNGKLGEPIITNKHFTTINEDDLFVYNLNDDMIHADQYILEKVGTKDLHVSAKEVLNSDVAHQFLVSVPSIFLEHM